MVGGGERQTRQTSRRNKILSRQADTQADVVSTERLADTGAVQIETETDKQTQTVPDADRFRQADT